MPIRKQLTEAAVLRIKPPKDRQFVTYHDGIQRGLFLRVSSKGKKTWCAQFYTKSTNKKGERTSIPTSKALGLYPTLGVKQARKAASTFLADPAKAKAADSGTFKTVADNFVRRYVEPNKLRSEANIKRCLEKYVYPIWANRPFREIKRADVADLLDKIQDNHGPRQADICLAIISKLMNWYSTRDSDYSSVIVKGMHRHNGGDHRRSRTLNDDELRAVWQACADQGTFGDLIKVLLLTAQRLDKVATMKWTDVVDGVWTIATAPREKGNAGRLRLPPMVLDVINSRPRVVGNPYIFAGRGGGPFKNFSQRKNELDEKLKPKPPKIAKNIDPWVLHDLRRTARSLMSRAGVNSEHAERVMGHAIRGIEGTYNRFAYDVEKADALVRLAALVAMIINPPSGNVADIAQAREARAR